MTSDQATNLEKYLAAITLILLEKRESDNSVETATKPELILSKAGFKAAEIAVVLNKKATAVQKTLQRAK